MDDAYAFAIGDPPAGGYGSWQPPPSVIDWAPAIRGILQDLAAGTPTGVVAARFHNTLVAIIVATAGIVGEERVVLTGGCFQNRYLTERAVSRLRQAGFRPYWHQRVPPNDGGIALGQIAAYLRSRPLEASMQSDRETALPLGR